MLAFVTLAIAFSGDCPDCDRQTPDVEPPVVVLRVLTAQKATASGLISYEVILTNRSAAKALDVKVKLDLPEKTTLHASSMEPARQQNLLTWNIGDMPGQCQRKLEVTLKTTADGPVQACFRVAYEHGVCVTTTAACKPPGKAEEEKLPVPKTAGQLTVIKMAPAKQGMGVPIFYSITVTNSGRIPLRDVEVDDMLPPNASFVQNSADNNGQLQGPESKKLQWRLGMMQPGDTRTVTFKVRPNQEGTYLNVASAHAQDEDGQRVQSKDSTTTTIVSGMATIYMEVKDTNDPVLIGGDNKGLTTYTILVRNTGNAAATNIRVIGDVPPGMVVTHVGPSQTMDAPDFQVGMQRVNFASFNLLPRQERTFSIDVRAEKPNLYKFRATLTSDILDPAKPPLQEEETTTVVNEIPLGSQTKLIVPEVGELAKGAK